MKQNLLILFLTCFLLDAFSSSGQCGDSCTTATPLTVTASGSCSYVSCTNVGATPSGVIGTPCSGVNNNDVWFTFTVPAGVTSLIGQVVGGILPAMDYPIIYFYRGSCGSLSPLGCNSGFPPVSTAQLQYSSFIPGEQIWVRVKNLGGTNDGTFQICVFNPCPSGSSPIDDPCSALVVPMTASCSSYTTLSNLCATPSAGIPAPGCGNYLGGDVWVQTIVGANGHLEVNFEQQSILDAACAVYTGTCSTLALVACSDAGGSGSLPRLFISSLPPNDTVWIRVWAVGGSAAGTIGICLTDPCPTVPSNDDPCNAWILPISAYCGSYTVLTNACASTSTGVPQPGCGLYLGGDVWVQTTVGASGILDVNFQELTLTDVSAAIYTGTCSALTLVACSDNDGPGNMPMLHVTGLAAGAAAWIRIWDNSNNDTGSVGICLSDPCPFGTMAPPLFDNPPCPMPDSASSYLPVVFGGCASYITYSSSCADPVFGTTPSGVPIPTGCSPTYPAGAATGWDVWAPLIIPDTLVSGIILFNTQPGTIVDLDLAVYRITSPVDSNCNVGSAYTLVACDESSGPGYMPLLEVSFGGANVLQPGDTVLVRMWDYFGGPAGSWGLCVSIPCPGGNALLSGYDDPPCPASAVLLPVTSGSCSTYQPGTNFCATTTPSPGNPGCGFWNNAEDVWYIVQMPVVGSGYIDINFQAGLSLADPGVAVYSGMPVSCGGTGLTLIDCDDDEGPGTLPYLSLTNPVLPGEYFYIRIWDYSGDETGDFALCVSDPCPTSSVDPPLFDNPPCPMPDTPSHYLPVSYGLCPTYTFCNSDCASSVFGTSPAGITIPSGCSGPAYPPGAATGWDVWIPVVVPDTPITGTLNIRAQAGTVMDLDMALYRITPPVFLNCGNGAMYNLLECDDLNGTVSMPFLSLPVGGAQSIQPGDTLLVRMWSKNGGSRGAWNVGASLSTLPSDSICIVKIDSLNNKNAVIWEKSGDPGIDSYRIYKEMSPGGFTLISIVSATAQSVFVDFVSNPALSAERYAMSIIDTCGNEYLLTRPHRTIHLAVNPDTSGGWNLAWNPYEGIDYTWTYILRGTTLNNLSVVDSVPAVQSAYSDTSILSGIVYYAVEVRKQPGCFPTPNPNGTLYNNSQSNIVAALGVGLGQDMPAVSEIQIYPNPVLHSTEISFSLIRTGAVRISILDIAGKEVNLLLNANLPAGQHRVVWDLTDQHHDPIAGGVYLVRVESGNYSDTRRVIVMPH